MSDIKHERPDAIEGAIFARPPRKHARPEGRTPSLYGGDDPTQPATFVLGFDTAGNHTDVERDIVAKRVEVSKRVHYYIKFSNYGHDVGHMVNPFGLYFNQAEVGLDDARMGKTRYEFRRVPENAFRDYLHFLHSKVEAHLRNAERQVLDA